MAVDSNGGLERPDHISRKVILEFPSHLVDKPIVWNLSTAHGLVFNILRANVDDGHGLLVLELRGGSSDYEEGISYLEDLGVQVQLLAERIGFEKGKCTDCGACLAMCPTRSFARDPTSMEVAFNQGECIACGMCVRACPARAISLEISQ